MKTMMPADSASQRQQLQLPSLLAIFWTFFKIRPSPSEAGMP